MNEQACVCTSGVNKCKTRVVLQAEYQMVQQHMLCSYAVYTNCQTSSPKPGRCNIKVWVSGAENPQPYKTSSKPGKRNLSYLTLLHIQG